jgi:predicted Zn-dependent protease
MFQTLEDEEPGKMERFLLSHPPTKERLAYAQERLATAEERDPASLQRPLLRDPYLARIEGLMLGQADGEKVVVSSTFYHKHYGASFSFPDSYAARLNPPDGEILLFRDVKEGEDSEKKPKTFRALIGFEVRPLHKPGQTTPEFIKEYLKTVKQSTHVKKTESLATPEGLELTVVTLDMSSARGPVRCLAGFVLQGKIGYILYGYTLGQHFEALEPEFRATILSLRFPPTEEIQAVQPPRLALVTVAEGETWESLAVRELGKADLARKLAAFNGFFDEAAQPPAGTRVKIPSVQALVSKES